MKLISLVPTQILNKAAVNDAGCPCIYCNDHYTRSKPKVVSLKCVSSKRWAHASYGDIPQKAEYFTCKLCM